MVVKGRAEGDGRGGSDRSMDRWNDSMRGQPDYAVHPQKMCADKHFGLEIERNREQVLQQTGRHSNKLHTIDQ